MKYISEQYAVLIGGECRIMSVKIMTEVHAISGITITEMYRRIEMIIKKETTSESVTIVNT